jgi:hypothetical protein
VADRAYQLVCFHGVAEKDIVVLAAEDKQVWHLVSALLKRSLTRVRVTDRVGIMALEPRVLLVSTVRLGPGAGGGSGLGGGGGIGGMAKGGGGGSELGSLHSSSVSMSSGGWGVGAGEWEGEGEEVRLRELLACALTRARGLLVLVSHPSLVLSNPYLSVILDLCVSHRTSDGALLGWRMASLRAGAGVAAGAGGASQRSEGTPAEALTRADAEQGVAVGDDVASTSAGVSGQRRGAVDDRGAGAGGRGSGRGDTDRESAKDLAEDEGLVPPGAAKTSEGPGSEQGADDANSAPTTRPKIEASSPMCGRMGVLWPSIPDRNQPLSRESTPSASPLLQPHAHSMRSPGGGPSFVSTALGLAALRLDSPKHVAVDRVEATESGRQSEGSGMASPAAVAGKECAGKLEGVVEGEEAEGSERGSVVDGLSPAVRSPGSEGVGSATSASASVSGTPQRGKWKVTLEIGNDASSPGNSGSDTSHTSTPYDLFPKPDSGYAKGVVGPASASAGAGCRQHIGYATGKGSLGGRGKDAAPPFESRFVASLKLSLDAAREQAALVEDEIRRVSAHRSEQGGRVAGARGGIGAEQEEQALMGELLVQRGFCQRQLQLLEEQIASFEAFRYACMSLRAGRCRAEGFMHVRIVRV